jgi:hypothetical protein
MKTPPGITNRNLFVVAWKAPSTFAGGLIPKKSNYLLSLNALKIFPGRPLFFLQRFRLVPLHYWNICSVGKANYYPVAGLLVKTRKSYVPLRVGQVSPVDSGAAPGKMYLHIPECFGYLIFLVFRDVEELDNGPG